MKRFLLCLFIAATVSVSSLPAQKTGEKTKAAEKNAPKTAPGKLLIAFSSYRDRPRHPSIFFYEHDGVDKGKMAGSVGTPRADNASGHPSLSQDGRFCTFTFEVENSTAKIFCWDRQEQKLVDMPVINDSTKALLRPSFSGDSNLIAFSGWGRPGGPGPGYHVFLYDRPAKKLIDLPGLNSQQFDDRLPALSGDGRFIAFVSNRKGGAGLTDLYLYDRKENKLLDVPGLNTKYSELEPSLSADGNLIAFSSERPDGKGGRDIYLFDRRVGKYLPLPGLNTAAHEVSPSLSADGRYLVFCSDRVDGEGDRDIYLYDREAQKLLPTPGLNSKTEDFDPCVIQVKAAE
jgi:Tol biopolymer transport system component